MMALDACFVFECLQLYVRKADEAPSPVPQKLKQLGNVLDRSGTSATYNATIRDLMMLENQIPLFLLEKLLQKQLGYAENEEKRLCNLIRLVCSELSPFKFKLLRTKERGHILEVLNYSLVLPSTNDEMNPTGEEKEDQPLPETKYITRAFHQLWKVLSSLRVGPIVHLKVLLRSLLKGRAVQFLRKLPLRLLSTLGNLPILRGLKGPLTIICASSSDTNKTVKDGVDDEESSVEIPPTPDELPIPSVVDLYSAGIKFFPQTEILPKYASIRTLVRSIFLK